mgnify:CR=1 FL=1
MQESIFVVFIFFIILMIGMIVFYQLEARSINNIRSESEENAFYHMISYVPSMPELQCSRLGIQEECIDLTKAYAFENLQSDYYQEVFGSKKIILEVDEEEILLYDWNPENFNGIRKINSPVSVFDSRENKYVIGVLEVNMYEK